MNPLSRTTRDLTHRCCAAVPPLQGRGEVPTKPFPSPLERGDHRNAMVGEVLWLT